QYQTRYRLKRQRHDHGYSKGYVGHGHCSARLRQVGALAQDKADERKSRDAGHEATKSDLHDLDAWDQGSFLVGGKHAESSSRLTIQYIILLSFAPGKEFLDRNHDFGISPIEFLFFSFSGRLVERPLDLP